MGYYLNPEDMTKEEWLEQNAELIGPNAPAEHTDGERVAACLVDNGFMKACGLAVSQAELQAFNSPNDPRPRLWYWISAEHVSLFR